MSSSNYFDIFSMLPTIDLIRRFYHFMFDLRRFSIHQKPFYGKSNNFQCIFPQDMCSWEFGGIQTPLTVAKVDLPSRESPSLLGEPTRAPPPWQNYLIRVPDGHLLFFHKGIAHVSSKFIIRPYRSLASS